MKNLKEMGKQLSRNEMKNIFAGQLPGGGEVGGGAVCGGSCDVTLDGVVKSGTCRTTVYSNLCYCSSGLGKCNP